MGEKLKIAVIAMQGDYEKHLDVLRRLGADAYPARLPQEVSEADGVILPGGESTTIGKMLARYGVDRAIREAAQAGKPVYGTCAGLILLAREIAAGTGERGGQPTLGLLDVVVARNAFGRQVDLFEAALDVPELGAEPLRAVFIRAPSVVSAGPSVRDAGDPRRQDSVRPAGEHPGQRVPPGIGGRRPGSPVLFVAD